MTSARAFSQFPKTYDATKKTRTYSPEAHGNDLNANVENTIVAKTTCRGTEEALAIETLSSAHNGRLDSFARRGW